MEPDSKKIKVEEITIFSEDIKESEKEKEKELPFHDFSVDRILFTDARRKTICVLGKFNGLTEPGIVVAEKQPLTESSLGHFFSPSSKVEKIFQNDIYSQYILDSSEGGLGEMRVTTVHPATEKHIRKYGSQRQKLVSETPEDYVKITKPYALEQSLSLDVCRFNFFSYWESVSLAPP